MPLNDNIQQLFFFIKSSPATAYILICLCSHLAFSQKVKGEKKKSQKHLICGNISWDLITLF